MDTVADPVIRPSTFGLTLTVTFVVLVASKGGSTQLIACVPLHLVAGATETRVTPGGSTIAGRTLVAVAGPLFVIVAV